MTRPVPIPERAYRPSNGTEGDIFQAHWCENCRRESEAHPCKILTSTMAFNIGDPEYPKEWIYSDSGEPTCTAFSDKHAPQRPYRCRKTIELFPMPEREA